MKIAGEVMRRLMVGEHVLDDQSEMYVIAEIGHNHQGDVEKCKELFRAAKASGAHAVKLQKRDNQALFTKDAYNKAYDNPHSFGETYGEHREFLELGWDEYVELKRFAAELELDFFATAFDIPSADFLAKLGVPAFKLASGDLKSLPLLKHVARFGKPMFVSTGGAMLEDVRRVCDAIMPINPQLCIMQCTAGYPPDWSELNLRVIETFRKEFQDVVIGFSSHDSGIAMAIAAYMLGARAIEKHFTLNRAMKGTDHAFSLEPVGLTKMVRDLRRLRAALGDGIKRTYASERQPLIKMGKSLYASRSLPKGHVLREYDIVMKSPGNGVPPWDIDSFIGRRLLSDVKEEQLLSRTLVE